jgi:hypothetical protein
VRGIEALLVAPEVMADALDDDALLEAGAHPQATAATPAGVSLDGEDPLEALRPAQLRWRSLSDGSARSAARAA